MSHIICFTYAWAFTLNSTDIILAKNFLNIIQYVVSFSTTGNDKSNTLEISVACKKTTPDDFFIPSKWKIFNMITKIIRISYLDGLSSNVSTYSSWSLMNKFDWRKFRLSTLSLNDFKNEMLGISKFSKYSIWSDIDRMTWVKPWGLRL